MPVPVLLLEWDYVLSLVWLVLLALLHSLSLSPAQPLFPCAPSCLTYLSLVLHLMNSKLRLHEQQLGQGQEHVQSLLPQSLCEHSLEQRLTMLRQLQSLQLVLSLSHLIAVAVVVAAHSRGCVCTSLRCCIDPSCCRDRSDELVRAPLGVRTCIAERRRVECIASLDATSCTSCQMGRHSHSHSQSHWHSC